MQLLYLEVLEERRSIYASNLEIFARAGPSNSFYFLE